MELWPDAVYVAVLAALCLMACWYAGQESGLRDRLLVYAKFLGLLVPSAFVTGFAYFDDVLCGRGSGDECDLGMLFGIVWLFWALVGYCVAVLLNEARLRLGWRTKASD